MTEVTRSTGPARHGAGGTGPAQVGVPRAGPLTELTVLYDAGCGLCRAAKEWLAAREQLVPLRFVPAGSTEARHRFPGLDHRATLREVTVVADTGEVWAGDLAWLTCLWALASYRDLAHRLAAPRWRPLAAQVVSTAARMRDRKYGDRDDRPGCDDQCRR